MRKPIPLLDDDKPLDVIAEGDYHCPALGCATYLPAVTSSIRPPTTVDEPPVVPTGLRT
jgi:hypothetical protein